MPLANAQNNEPALIAAIDADANNPLLAKQGAGGIRWNHKDDIGAVSLCGGPFAQHCGLTVGSDGTVYIFRIQLPWGPQPPRLLRVT